MPGALGIDLASESTDVDALRCRRLVNLDIVPPTAEAPIARVLPRGLLRRWGYLAELATLVIAAGAELEVGTYWYVVKHDDGAGVVTWYLNTVTTTGGNERVTVSGWPANGTVTIYRSLVGASTPATVKLVTAAFAGTTVSHLDVTPDGSLGATLDYDTVFRALDSNAFDQSVRVHQMRLVSSANETSRILIVITSANAYRAQLDVGEFLLDMPGSGGTSQPCDIAPLGDMVFVANSGTALKYIAMGSLSSGIQNLSQPATPTLTLNAPGVGTLTTVTSHKYIAIRVHPQTGIRSLPSNIITVGPGGPQLNNLSVTSVAGTDFEIYRTSDGGQFFQYLKTVTGGGAFSDDAADSTLSQKTASVSGELAGAPESGFQFCAAHKSILFAFNKIVNGSVEAAPSELINSGPDPYNFPQDPFIANDYRRMIDEDDGDEGAGLRSWGEVLILFKRRRVYMLTGDPPTGFRWAAVIGSDSAGCISHRTIVETPIGLMWLGPAGWMLMTEPGARPMLLSQALRDVLVDPERQAALENTADGTPQTERPAIEFEHVHAGTDSPTGRHFQIQLDTGDFSSPDFDYQSGDSTERPYFTKNNLPYPGDGIDLRPGRKVRIAVTPPASGPVAGTTYNVRYRIGNGLVTWLDWVTLDTYTPPNVDRLTDRINWDSAVWSFAVHHAKRQEVFLFIPTGSRTYCDQCYVLNYGAMLAGGGPLWRGPIPVAATAGCLVDEFVVNGKEAQDYILLASPDGLLYVYPYLHSVVDHDTRVAAATLTAAMRETSGTVTAGVYTVTPTPGWPEAWPKMRGQIIVCRDADGETYTGLISNNTDDDVTATWLGGRTPVGAVDAVIGGLETVLETGWLNLSGDRRLTSILREASIQSAPFRNGLRLDVLASDGPQETLGDLPRVGRDVPVGEGFQNLATRIDLRGHLHKLKLSGTSAKPFEVLQVDLEVEETGSDQ